MGILKVQEKLVQVFQARIIHLTTKTNQLVNPIQHANKLAKTRQENGEYDHLYDAIMEAKAIQCELKPIAQAQYMEPPKLSSFVYTKL